MMQERIDQILRELAQEEIEKAKSDASSLLGKTKSKMNIFQSFWVQVASSGLLVWQTFLAPLWNIVYWMGAGLLWRNYKKIWDRFAYTTINDERTFSRKRGHILCLEH